MDDVKITAPNTGKHIAIAGDINSILASKDDTDGTFSVVEVSISQWRFSPSYSNS